MTTTDTGTTTGLIRRAHARLREALQADRDGENPDDPATVQAMPLVMEFPRDPVPDRRALLEAAATACVAVCLDPRAGEDSLFADALGRWYGARIRKIARRARNRRWRDVQALPGVTVRVHGASVRAFTPCPVAGTPEAVNKLQIQGADLPPDPSYRDTPESVLAADGAPVIYVDASLGMTVGKAAAQVSHGSMLLAGAMDEDAALAWAMRGFPLHVCEVDAARFAEVRATAEGRIAGATAPGAAVVQDAGYTEIAPGSFTVVALTR
ncbi:aminoacyl-tRNA hydrolase [uncultured Corynebacterium sp.]|uniref:aminoacyl-tRNA hydrolase n=1 Tax=uncultured Corynebacterium sp. TaxID=159447 RepID=UPI0025D917BA|nr:aminoacyl-tRNA hydrolase [uncultured Corynebacterium sp.]